MSIPSRFYIPCPQCGGRTDIREITDMNDGVRRRRKCRDCGYNFPTRELPADDIEQLKQAEQVLSQVAAYASNPDQKYLNGVPRETLKEDQDDRS